MTHEVYSVKDELQGVYLTPQYFENEKLALRQFKYQVNNIEQWKYDSTDYSLYKLGTFNDEDGVYTSNIEKVATGRSVLDE